MGEMNSLFEGLDGCGAEISPDGVYRYTLTRQWEDGPCVCWLCFNPSTATAEQDDASIRRIVGFSKLWGYGRMVVVNLYAIRSRSPIVVRYATDPVGPMNDYWIGESLKESRELICAWGCAQHAPNIVGRIKAILEFINSEKYTPETPINCLGYRKDGHPRHPLMLSYETQREEFILKRK
jgi:hypothetical protein